jgi:uncharacterized membrane protein
MLLVGLVFGRWWRVTIPVGTLVWVVLLVATGTGSGLPFVLGGAAFGAANVIVGVLAYQVIAWLAHVIVQTLRPASRS